MRTRYVYVPGMKSAHTADSVTLEQLEAVLAFAVDSLDEDLERTCREAAHGDEAECVAAYGVVATFLNNCESESK